LNDKNALIFIPDISGFTRFINSTEIDHSKHIIEELVEVVLHANEMNLNVSEIEGDAILFYKFGEAPAPDEIARQSKIFFLNFHNYLKQIEKDSVCQCGACSTVSQLTLKFFLHYGEIAVSQIRDHTKIVGKNVIIVHRLMKNSIQSDEYLLMSKAYTEKYPEDILAEHFNWSELKNGSDNYEHLGNIDYDYVALSPLLNDLTVLSPPRDAKKFKNPVSVSTYINKPLSEVYKIVIDLAQRLEWTEGLSDITFDKNKIHRIGMKHICELPTGTVELETIQNKIEGGKIEYAEKAVKSILFPQATTFFIMEKENSGTRFTAQFHYSRIFVLGLLLDMLFRDKLTNNFNKSIQNLKMYCEKKEKKNS
jgi:hypothetical protein